ncbi:hypothetical protein [Citrobacter werkmanii]|uniref:hypothetical protein n=1 Tax=Citrobacter werkmanii TaxID=67827 RepID=UPI00264E9F01|nr:hypothetical protein [Citrobacter werkmanii]MDN8559107.1 hypothetical protein [Citrobacter werkmanii]
MRPFPDYLPYRQPRPPQVRRWLSAGALFPVISSGAMMLLPVVHRGGALMIGGLVCGIALTATGWLIHQLCYRTSLHHAQYYEQLVERERQRWWARHRQSFALCDMVLLGPVGCEAAHWQNLLRREHQAPEEKIEASGRALRLIHSFVNDPDVREQQLAGMLMQQWLTQRGKRELPLLSHCYWQGSALAWRAFCEPVAEQFPAFQLPAEPKKWQGEASLSAIAAQINEAEDDGLILVAGCQSLTATPGSTRPAGESAVLWLISREGAARISRGEVYDVGQGESLADVCQRAMQQSETDLPPDPCIAFTQPQVPELDQSGWNVVQYLQDVNWGDTGHMEALIVITLAAMFAAGFQQPCGWIARDPEHTLALGIITPDK